jgi:nitrogen fixation-related uncharacterized protein
METMTVVFQIGGFLVGLGGFAWAILTYVSGQFRLRDDAIRASERSLDAHKLEVAQTYVTKAGMQEQTLQIMKAIDSVGSKIDHLNGRIDGLMQPKTTPRSRAS